MTNFEYIKQIATKEEITDFFIWWMNHNSGIDFDNPVIALKEWLDKECYLSKKPSFNDTLSGDYPN